MPTKTPRINQLFQIVRFLRVSHLLFWIIWVMYRERRRVVLAHARGNYAVRLDSDILIEALIAFRERALELGFLMIKLGQFLSTRADLLPQKAIGILSSLQDEVPPAPFDHVVRVIESELGKPVEEVFSVLERKCTSAASLGQVHKAILAATGEMVAVKIQRPDSDRLVQMDLRSLKFVLWIITRFIDTNQFIDLMGVYDEFERTVYEEIDYVQEAANAKRFKEMFKDNSMIYIPRIYDLYVSQRMLVLEWIDGVIFEHLLKAFGISSLLNVVDLFIDRPFKLVVDTHEINKLVRIYEACNDPENELEATQIHLHEPVTIGPLDFDGHHFTGGSEDCFMDLTERAGGSTFALQHAEHFLNRLAQLQPGHK